MPEYRYQLDKKGKKHTCPGCGKKRFVYYTDSNTGQYMPEQYGRCDRAVNCAYHLNPYKDGYVRSIQDNNRQGNYNYHQYGYKTAITPQIPVSFIPSDMFNKSQTGYKNNHFYTYLCSLFHQDTAITLMHRFNIGTSRYWNGATVFWQVDPLHQIRTGKVMLYNPVTGKREKQVLQDGSKRSLITWVHTVLKLDTFNLQQCLFGLQQLSVASITKPVAIVESEKTAIIATVYLPQFIWLACGSLTNLTRERLQPLAGRKIFLFPDLGAYESWHTKCREIQKALSCKISVSDLLERQASETDKANGLDLADYLIKRDNASGWALTDHQYPLFWDNPLGLPVPDSKEELYKQELMKYHKQSGNCNIYDLALYIGIDLQTAVNICEEISKKYGYEIQ